MSTLFEPLVNSIRTGQVGNANSLPPVLSTGHSHRSFGLDLARTVAISLVLASHFGHNLLDSLGFWGVELFFALSGFLIGQILWRNFSQTSNWTWAHVTNFWSRRWWRTLPNYYLFLGIMLVSAFINSEAIPSLLKLFKFLWFGQFMLEHNWGFYSVSWSLCIEEWFYLLFPLVLLAFSRVITSSKLTFVFTLLFFFVASAFVRRVLINQDASYYLRGITFARLDAIGYGVFIAYLSSIFEVNASQKYIAFFIGVLLQAFTALNVITSGLAHVVTSQIFLVLAPLGFALMIPLISVIPAPVRRTSIFIKVVGKISLWSYSIYLSHGPLMWLSYFILNNYRNTFYGNLSSKIVGVLLTLITSAILYKFFEVPLTMRRPKELK